jgi:hypothetical protein
METPVTPPQEPRKNRSNTGLLLLVLLLLISNVALLYLYMSSRTAGEQKDARLDQLSVEKENVTFLLEGTLASYDTLRTENEQLNAEIAAQREQVEQLLDQVKRGNYDLSRARKEAETLRKIMQGYVVTIDSLNQLNQALMAENITIRQELGEVMGQKEALQARAGDLEGIVARGSVLHTTAISSTALFMRNNGKQQDTDRARKAEMIKCCFTLGENKITTTGDKTLYMRVISPDGSVLPASDPNNRFQFEGVEGEYSARREVNYQGQPVDVCVFWNGNGAELRTGVYNVEIYEAGALVGKSSFTLK